MVQRSSKLFMHLAFAFVAASPNKAQPLGRYDLLLRFRFSPNDPEASLDHVLDRLAHGHGQHDIDVLSAQIC